MKTKNKVQTIFLSGRRWFDKVNGNTYHSAKAYINGELIGQVDFEYGYGDSCITQTAWGILIEKGLVKPEKYPHGGHESPFRYCEQKKIKFSSDVVDVTRKKDLI